MDKRKKKILLLSIFGGAAALISIGYLVFILWALAKIFPHNNLKESALRFVEFVHCQSQSHSSTGNSRKCVDEWLNASRTNAEVDTKREENPAYNACMYEQEVLLEALSASKTQGEALFHENTAKFCDFQLNPSSAINNTDVYAGYTALKLLKDELASQAILNFRYKKFKKKNYPLELEALNIYRELREAKSCDSLEKSMTSLTKQGSIFILGSKAICELQACTEAELDSCPKAKKLGERMKSLGDIAGNFILMHEAALDNKQSPAALNYARLALLSGYTDILTDYPELEEEFYSIKFDSDSLAFGAARLMNADKTYTPALNCIAASLNKDWDFETLLKYPQAFSKEQWVEKISTWASEDSDLLLRLACEVLTDAESKKRIHEFYMNDGNEDGSAFDFCTVIQDPLFKESCFQK